MKDFTKFASVACLALSMPVAMNAQLSEGRAVFKNVESGLFWGAGNNWGTRGSLLPYSEFQTLAQQPDGTYTMETQVSNGGTSYYFGGEYMDGSPVNLNFEEADNGFYKVFFVDGNGENCYLGNGDEAGVYAGSFILGRYVDENGDGALWQVIPESEWASYLSAATQDAPLDATFYVLNPNFGRNNRNTSAWTMEAGNKNLSGGTNENRCAESWRSSFTLAQTITNLPNGVYGITAQAALTDYTNQYDGADYPVVYANDESVPFKEMDVTDRGTSMTQLSNAFANGNYQVDPIFIRVENGTITLGVKGTRTDTWCIWDNFRLTYYGTDAKLSDLKFAAFKQQIEDMFVVASKYLEELEADAAVYAVNNAMMSYLTLSSDPTEEELNAVYEALVEAIDIAKVSLTAKAGVNGIDKLIESTNVYSAEALAAYKAAVNYDEIVAKYMDGTITAAEAGAIENPDNLNGWHNTGLAYDALLMDAWDADAHYTDNSPYYINTWSVEGDNDGTNFRVPFFEYWVPDAQSVAPRTLTATLTDIPEGTYDVSAWVRVRRTNDVDDAPTGITLQVNDGDAVDVCTGKVVEYNGFMYLDTFTAQGDVASDGVLKIKFIVADDNNISWLAFRNVKYVEGVPTAIKTVGTAASTDATYSLSGQRVEKPVKGLYIRDGRKVIVK